MLLTQLHRMPDDHILIFIHIIKTGGVSLHRALAPLFEGTEFRHSPRKGTSLHHLEHERLQRLSFISGHFSYGIHEHFEKLPLYLTVVRDPVERITSLYHHIARTEHHRLHAAVVEMGIDGFARRLTADSTLLRFPSQCRIISGEPDFDRARRRLQSFLAYCETSQVDDLITLLYRLKQLPAPERLPKDNARPPTQRQEELSEQTKSLLRRHFGEDERLVEYCRTKFIDAQRSFGRADPGRQAVSV